MRSKKVDTSKTALIKDIFSKNTVVRRTVNCLTKSTVFFSKIKSWRFLEPTKNLTS